jgi:2-keto-4-pentenoate hydratase/2-oxohepta-3-ene-1,7-dioic acid hydratase in catechol pathway
VRLCSVRTQSGTELALAWTGGRVVPAREVLGRAVGGTAELLAPATLAELAAATRSPLAPTSGTTPAALPLRPGKIIGIGLNYAEHAGDLGAAPPKDAPVTFFKAEHTVIGGDEPIRVPEGIGRVTAEAELGLVIGRECYQVDEDEALSYVAGVIAILDQTAEDVLLRNPRYLTWSKNYPTFLSLGSEVITLDEVTERFGDLGKITVATIHNGVVHRMRPVADMTFGPAQLIGFCSRVMPLHPGDVISTGTPGAVPITPGDTVGCELGEGFAVLFNAVTGPSGAAV